MAANVIIAGDCGPAHGPEDGFPVGGYIDLIAPTLKTADFRLVNCMRTYSTSAAENSDAPQVAQPIAMAELYMQAGFDGITMANNHAFDAGPQAMLDTVKLFRARGIQVTGAGRNFVDASAPVILEKDGLRIAYLGCTSLGKPDGAATGTMPGVLNIGVNTRYEHRGPHAPVRILTAPDENDLMHVLNVIRELRPVVDRLIVAFHSGVIRVPRVVSDYQVTVAHALIDAGADLIVCHAPHIPKGIEVYKGKVIFYSIGVFAMTKPFAAPSWSEPAWSQGAIRNHMDLHPDYPFMPYGTDSRFALLAKAGFDRGKASRVSFLPLYFDQRYRPQALEGGDPRFKEVVDYIEWASVDMPHTFSIEGNEVVVTA
ncbi:CapA family protein [Rhizobium sp. Leaf386]|uniref:CapA family protein n=1 Tax=Rhizobium sp. Leaf386 TaxID=1736359 RepID=UPI0007160B9D|nr:CapA family protein [Rhizobium sp. Leaf386]KQS95472.1 hypothetical protein ASG50_24490 [Rhizobium sp. Leaf386]